MKLIHTILAIALAADATSFAEEAALAPSGAFSINQRYENGWEENITFRDPKIPTVSLAGYPWRGLYSISPDERWILRIQKAGSGDNIAILYQLENNGRVLEVIDFNALLWTTSDRIARWKNSELYHTGVAEYKWSEASNRLHLTMRGSNANQSEHGIQVALTYELATHRLTPRTEPSGTGQPATAPDSKPK